MTTRHPPAFDPGVNADPVGAGFCAARLARLGALLRHDVERGVMPGAVVLIVRDGIVAAYDAVGYAERSSLRAMQRDSIFRIASMTKPLTAVAALMLMERGEIQLSDPVSRFLPEFAQLQVGVEHVDADGQRRLELEPMRQPVTVHDLMRHTAGFTYGQLGDSLVQRAYRAANLIDNQQTNAEFTAKLSRIPLSHQPGSTFGYGMSTDVLGRVIEVASGRSLDQFFREHITGPLGMTCTAFGLRPGDAGRLAEPQHDAPPGAPPAVIPYDPARPTAWFSGGGGLLATALDYARFCQVLLGGGEYAGVRLLGRKTLQLMLQNHLPAGLRYAARTADLGVAAPLPDLGQGYGLGLGVRTHAGLSPVPGSIGDCYWGGVLGPYFWVDPAERLSVVFMLQELDVQRRTRYRSVLRALVYQALQ